MWRSRKRVIGLFHPELDCLVYTSDHDATPQTLMARAIHRFGVTLLSSKNFPNIAKRSLRAAEDRLRAFANADGSSPSIGAVIYASRFSSNLLRSLRRRKRSKMPHTRKVLPLLPPKPSEPDFTTKEK
ncbi:unnamed protein product [Lupinus luteus]|uniref:NYN domain-containing protein n=1 Tax=Lupinus luteus TaxID=3873 RepID=A0AAV1X1X3_LUPLU